MQYLMSIMGGPENARLLIQHGARLNRLDRDGQSPLAIAECCGHDEVTGVLRDHGAQSVGRFQGLEPFGSVPLLVDVVGEY